MNSTESFYWKEAGYKRQNLYINRGQKRCLGFVIAHGAFSYAFVESNSKYFIPSKSVDEAKLLVEQHHYLLRDAGKLVMAVTANDQHLACNRICSHCKAIYPPASKERKCLNCRGDRL